MNNQSKITKVKKNSDGYITDVMLSNGTVCPISNAISMAKEGDLEGVNVGKAKNGREYLRSNPNGELSDNLDNLQTF